MYPYSIISINGDSMNEKLTCNQCGNTWKPRTNQKPKRCPNPKCRSQLWQTGKKQTTIKGDYLHSTRVWKILARLINLTQHERKANQKELAKKISTPTDTVYQKDISQIKKILEKESIHTDTFLRDNTNKFLTWLKEYSMTKLDPQNIQESLRGKLRREQIEKKTIHLEELVTDRLKTFLDQDLYSFMRFAGLRHQFKNVAEVYESYLHVAVFNFHSQIEIKGKLQKAQSYANQQKRVFIPFESRNLKQWKNLTWEESETSCLALALRNVQMIPYPIPLKTTLEEWKEHKIEAKKKIHPGQELFPVLSSRHDPDTFISILKEEINNSLMIGIS